MAKRRARTRDLKGTPGKGLPLADQTNNHPPLPAFSPALASPPPKRNPPSLKTPDFCKRGLFTSPVKESPVSKLTKSVSTQTDPVACLGFEDEILAKDPSQELQQLAFNTLEALHSKQKNKDYVRLSMRHGARTYLNVPSSRFTVSKSVSNQVNKKLNKHSNLVSGLLQRLFGGGLQRMMPAILAKIGRQFRLTVLPLKDCVLNIVQAAALRDYVPTSTRGLERLANALHDFVPILGKLLFPRQLRRRISEFEKCTLDVELSFEVISLEMNGDGKMKPCVHAWVSNLPVVVEGLTRSALIAGKFQESDLLSAHKAEVLIIQGCDKGGSLTLSLMRIANRVDGNAPQFCFPLAFYEDARESYSNLERTIYDNSKPATKPVQSFLQSLLDGKFHMLIVSSCCGSELIDAQCLLIEFSGYSVYEKQDSSIHHDCSRLLPDADHRELFVNTEEARARTRPVIVTLDRVRCCPLAARLVLADPTDEDVDSSEGTTYSGLLLYQSLERRAGTLVGRLHFTSALFVPSTASVKLQCYGCRPFTADDLKLNVAVSGQGTASSKYPCPICVASSDEFGHCIHGLIPPPLRDGENNNNQLYEKFKEVAGARALKVSTDSSAASMHSIKDKAKSVVHRPLLLTPPSQNTAGSMHVCQGMMTHLHTSLGGRLGCSSRSIVERATNLQTEREQHAVKSGMAAWSAVLKAASELSLSGNKFIKDSGSKPEGEASYLFYQSICVDGGVRFNVEHSGLELTNANGIKVLSQQDIIAKRVEKAYIQEETHNLQSEVRAVMATWRRLAALLLELSRTMKRQSKLSEEEISRFKQCAIEYGREWTSMIPGKDNVFNKLHTLIAHLTTFAEVHKTIGLVNEESFEATHPRAQTISNHLKSMVSTEGKVDKIVQRFSLGLHSDYQMTRTALQDERKTGPRKLKDGDRYKVSHRTRQQDIAPICNSTSPSMCLLPQELVRVATNQAVVKKEWHDYYNYLVCGRVPDGWRRAFGDDDNIGKQCIQDQIRVCVGAVLWHPKARRNGKRGIVVVL
ncbi:hypothetical protein SEMRO_2382_G325600.1 [Seminavis robusta]|uniref:Uncharacterized protein n=1 Tax=Seminavis robusta TaxID=568900 RepID=A0A9N8F013_9STRA|nr:hypothetical protein SEMRO_2382_G325600.1 [Seminavis robusta]|eukprot:Sro2382_g325600.1 n/a (1030) ;mRNA; f:11611-14855